MAMAHELGVRRGVSGGKLSFKKMSAGVASVLCKKTPIFGSRRSKLDHLTVYQLIYGEVILRPDHLGRLCRPISLRENVIDLHHAKDN